MRTLGRPGPARAVPGHQPLPPHSGSSSTPVPQSVSTLLMALALGWVLRDVLGQQCGHAVSSPRGRLGGVSAPCQLLVHCRLAEGLDRGLQGIGTVLAEDVTATFLDSPEMWGEGSGLVLSPHPQRPLHPRRSPRLQAQEEERLPLAVPCSSIKWAQMVLGPGARVDALK